MDTDPISRARLLDLLRALSPSERLTRALALSALARTLAWQGALQASGDRSGTAALHRFLEQLYGPDVAARVVPLAPNALGGE
jgi:hypothetical protein